MRSRYFADGNLLNASGLRTRPAAAAVNVNVILSSCGSTADAISSAAARRHLHRQ
jgi:hypothetical protein